MGTTDYVIRPVDREWFKRCRRAWDLGARGRGNYEPIVPARMFDFDQAVAEALAVYYFPSMWDWNRAVVQPLSLKAFVDSMSEQRAKYTSYCQPSSEENQEWEEHLELGKSMLQSYFAWAPTVDRFTPIRAYTYFSVNIPDPRRPGHNLATPDGNPIRYLGRVDLLVADENDVHWLIDHRTVGHEWDNVDLLVLDESHTSDCWAWDLDFIGTNVAGVIYNQLRRTKSASREASPMPNAGINDSKDLPLPKELRRVHVRPVQATGSPTDRQGNEFFRRTAVSWSRTQLQSFQTKIVDEIVEMTDPKTRVYANPSKENCERCDFRQPCLALNVGADLGPILAASYRQRSPEELEKGRIGAQVWGFGHEQVRVRPPKSPRKVRAARPGEGW